MLLHEAWFVGTLVTLTILSLIGVLAYTAYRAKEKEKLSETNMQQREIIQRLITILHRTTEHVVIFLPLFWITLLIFHKGVALVMALVWFISRLMYARGYYNSEEEGTIGGLITVLVVAILFLTSLMGLLQLFLA